MEVSVEDKAIISHVVVDPDAWIAHAIEAVGEWAVLAKIAKHKSDYLAKKDLIGYKSRADREIAALAEKGKTEGEARALLGLPLK